MNKNFDDTDCGVGFQGPNGEEMIGKRVHRFEDLNLPKALLSGIYNMNYKAPSNIQGSILPLLLGTEHPNVVCQSQTGTGKTGAFTIAMLHRIDPEIDATQALCIAPTRELARQIVSYVNIIARFMPEITTEVAIPGTVNKRTGEKVTAHIVVGTPGTVMDCLRRGMIDSKKLKVLVMDEADSLMELQGLGEQAIRVKNLVPKGTQFLLFSATFGGQVLKYANVFAPNAYKLTLKRHELTMAGIHQIYMDCKDEEDKYRVLNSLYYTCTVASSIIFVKRRETANIIAKRLEADGHKVGVLHAALDSVESRDNVIDSFRRGECKVLITTNVLARGIDVANTSMVINYDLPRTVDDAPDFTTYLHRIGRTGRNYKSGCAVSFIHNKRSWLELREIQKYFGVPIHQVPADNLSVVEDLIKTIMKNNKAKRDIGDVSKSRHAEL